MIKVKVKDRITYNQGTIRVIGKADIESTSYAINKLMELSALVRSAINKFKTESELIVTLFNNGNRITIKCNSNIEVFKKLVAFLRKSNHNFKICKTDGIISLDSIEIKAIGRKSLLTCKVN